LCPVRASINRDMNSSVVSSSPNAIDVQRRRCNAINYAALRWLGCLLIAILAHARGYFKRRSREVRRYLLPALTSVQRLPQCVGAKIKNMWIDGREDNRFRAHYAEISSAKRLRHNVLRLASATVIACKLAAINGVRVEGIGHHIAILFRRHRMPFAHGN